MEQLIRALDFPSCAIDSFENLFRIKLSRYIRGRGIPTSISDVSEADRAAANYELYRSELLLRAATSSMLEPSNPNWAIYVSTFVFCKSLVWWVCQFEFNDVSEDMTGSDQCLIKFSTCTHTVQVSKTQALLTVLQQATPSRLDESTQFDEFMYMLLIGNEYTTL